MRGSTPWAGRVAALVLIVVCGLGAAGCGGETKEHNAYVDAVNRAQNDFATQFSRLSDRITATSTARQDRETLKGFETVIEGVVRRLRTVKPPARVSGLHEELIGAIDSYGREIEKARDRFRSRSPARIIAAQTELIGAITAVSARINRTIDQINSRLRA
jgi:hypothetical protein